MLVTNVSEEPRISLGREHGRSQCVDGGVTESLVVEPTMLVEPIEVFLVLFRPEETQISNLEVAEELAIVVLGTRLGIEQPAKVCLRVHELGICFNKSAGLGPEGGKGASVVEDVHVEAVFELVVAHEAEDIVFNVAEEMHLEQVE